jgi:NitT/TauT family transport system substrate-binding protein
MARNMHSAVLRAFISIEGTHAMARFRLLCLAAVATLAVVGPANAADKVNFLTSWYAQAEHGGFYQAKAAGLYDNANLDVTIKMGGPQVNGMQLLLGGEADVIMGYDFQVLNGISKGLPVITIGTSFQKDLQGMMTHADVKDLGDLKDHTILVATSGRTTWWPWLKNKFGYTDEQTQPYTFNLQPFFADDKMVQQSYPSSEPFQALEKNLPVNFYLFADYGYPPYGTTMVTTTQWLSAHPDIARRFVKASMEGWKSYLEGDAGPANKLIKADNPNMTDAQIAFGIKRMNELHIVDGGDAKTMGIGIMTEQRWNATYDLMVATGLLPKDTDWKKGFTTDYVKDLKIMW